MHLTIFNFDETQVIKIPFKSRGSIMGQEVKPLNIHRTKREFIHRIIKKLNAIIGRFL